MSYARFSDGDVYVFKSSVDEQYVCCACTLTGELRMFTCATPSEMAVHLLTHRQAGDNVPQDAIDRLGEEAQ